MLITPQFQMNTRSNNSFLVAPLLATLLLGAIAIGTGACGASRADNSVKYAVTAQQNYAKGEEKLKSKAWVGAAKYFAFVKARFAYSKFAVLAELRLADAEFGAGHYLQAVDGYKMFIKFHPTHDMVINGYCSFRIGEAYYKMLPGDWWLLPPSFEKISRPPPTRTANWQPSLRSFPSRHTSRRPPRA